MNDDDRAAIAAALARPDRRERFVAALGRADAAAIAAALGLNPAWVDVQPLADGTCALRLRLPVDVSDDVLDALRRWAAAAFPRGTFAGLDRVA